MVADHTADETINPHMTAKAIILTVALCFVGEASCFAKERTRGHVEAKRGQVRVKPRGPKNQTVVYEVAGDNVKVTVDGTDNDGKPLHNEWTGKFDGKDYPVIGDPN